MLMGSRVRFFGRFRNAAGELADPTDVRATIFWPGITGSYLVNYSYGDGKLLRLGVGVYYIEMLITFVGTVAVHFASAASGEESQNDNTFTFRTSRLK